MWTTTLVELFPMPTRGRSESNYGGAGFDSRYSFAAITTTAAPTNGLFCSSRFYRCCCYWRNRFAAPPLSSSRTPLLSRPGRRRCRRTCWWRRWWCGCRPQEARKLDVSSGKPFAVPTLFGDLAIFGDIGGESLAFAGFPRTRGSGPVVAVTIAAVVVACGGGGGGGGLNTRFQPLVVS